jgi:hypothetical protein
LTNFLNKVISDKNLIKEKYLNIKDISDKMNYETIEGNIFEIPKKEKNLKIKLIITETLQSTKDHLGRQIISPVLQMLNISPTFGIFHTSLL